jgi:hypothetical protein
MTTISLYHSLVECGGKSLFHALWGSSDYLLEKKKERKKEVILLV